MIRSITNVRRGNLLLLLAAFLLTFTACEGPAGSQGPQGPEGPQGEVGPAGEDGSVIFAGAGSPSSDLGVNGDYYLDQNTGELYGPKNGAGWGTPISLQGPPGADGQDGEDGSQIYSGTSAPDTSQGSPGDYYLNTATFDLYGPKTDSGWGTPINLKGTANVLYSSWIDIVWDVQDDSTFKIMSIPESRVTDEFLNSGVVKMYMKFEGSNADGSLTIARALPYSSLEFALSYAVITTKDQPDSSLPPNFAGLLLYQELEEGLMTDIGENEVRYVLIPGGEQLEAKAKAGKLPIDLDNYEQVKRYFGMENTVTDRKRIQHK